MDGETEVGGQKTCEEVGSTVQTRGNRTWTSVDGHGVERKTPASQVITKEKGSIVGNVGTNSKYG